MKWSLSLAALLLAGCGHVSLESYDGTSPRFDLLQYFSGPGKAWGMVQNYRGQVVRRFEVDLCGQMDGQTLVLDEDFLYDDGETQYRQWRITPDEAGYVGRADDIVGEAAGEPAGFALQWAYTMDLEVDDSTYRVRFDDWMYRLDNQHVFNKARIKKWGFTVAEVTLFFEKREGSCGGSA